MVLPGKIAKATRTQFADVITRYVRKRRREDLEDHQTFVRVMRDLDPEWQDYTEQDRDLIVEALKMLDDE
jgi:predicted CopG family antitoxin